jgi:hypothetical protein
MVMTNETDGTKRSVSSLGELSRDVSPPRDLWPAIAAQVAKGVSSDPEVRRSRLRPTGLQWAALAAVVSALAVGVWLGRSVLPAAGQQPAVAVAANGTATNGSANGSSANSAANGTTNGVTAAVPANGAPPASGQGVLPAALVTDPRYTMQRAAMIRELEGQLKNLPVETQQKVAASLTSIRASMNDIQAALGRDPANMLLQELLVNSYQDEMRVLTAVNEASDAGRGI